MPELHEEAFNPIESDKEKEQQEEEAKHKKQNRDYVWRGILIVGLVALLALGILLPIRIVPNVVADLRQNILSFFSKKEAVSLNKKTIASGDSFTLNLNATSTEPQSAVFTLTYPCRNGVYLEYSATEGNQPETISCETPFTFTSATKSITLRAVSLNETSVEQPISIDMSSAASSTDSSATGTASTDKVHVGDVVLTISNANAAQTTASSTTSVANNTQTTSTSTNNTSATTSPVTTYNPSQSQTGTSSQPAHSNTSSSGTSTTPSKPYIPTDLAVIGLKVGIMGSNGQLVETNTVRSTDTVLVRFIINNTGARSSAGWTFEAALPTFDPQYALYRSPAQASIGQGSGIINTLSISGLRPGVQTISISVDPSHSASDSDRTNNTASTYITVIQ